jgi:hypothetical protein
MTTFVDELSYRRIAPTVESIPGDFTLAEPRENPISGTAIILIFEREGCVYISFISRRGNYKHRNGQWEEGGCVQRPVMSVDDPKTTDALQ